METNQAIEKMLTDIIDSFESKNHSFLVNIWFNNTGTIQIVHPNMMKVTYDPKKTFGIATSLNFNVESEHLEFKESQDVMGYKYYEFDGIHSYVKNYITDIELAETEIIDILKSIYKVKDNSILEIEIYDQGPIEYAIPN